jgi:hypothetical protein
MEAVHTMRGSDNNLMVWSIDHLNPAADYVGVARTLDPAVHDGLSNANQRSQLCLFIRRGRRLPPFKNRP